MAQVFNVTGQQLIGTTLFPLSLTGLICNSIIVYITFQIRSLSPSFAFLTGFLAFFDSMFNLLYLGYMTPMIVFDLKTLKDYSYQCTYLLMLSYDASFEIHLLISLNRFFAVFAPMWYRRMFDLQKTKIYAYSCAIFTLVNVSIFSKIVGCRISYNDEIWMLYYDTVNELCLTYSWIIDMIKNLGVCCFDAIISVITILKVHWTRKQLQKSTCQKTKSSTVRKKELDFLKQTSVQGVITLFAISIYCFVPDLVTNQYVAFMLTTFLIGTVSTVDGITALIYNTEIRSAIFRTRKVSRASVISVTELRISNRGSRTLSVNLL